jgi:hypothetical protein
LHRSALPVRRVRQTCPCTRLSRADGKSHSIVDLLQGRLGRQLSNTVSAGKLFVILFSIALKVEFAGNRDGGSWDLGCGRGQGTVQLGLGDRPRAFGRPAAITRKGREAVVVVSAEEWNRKTKRKGNLAEFFAASPFRGSGVRISGPRIGRARLSCEFPTTSCRSGSSRSRPRTSYPGWPTWTRTACSSASRRSPRSAVESS